MVLDECQGVDDYTRQAAVLTAYAESDYRSDAVQHGQTFGVFQQNPRWWPTAHGTTTEQCRAFLDDFTSKEPQHTGRLVPDCWLTQQWAAPDPRHDPAGFAAAPETLNYQRRVPLIPAIIRTGELR